MGRLNIAYILLALAALTAPTPAAAPGFSQDDDVEFVGRVLDASDPQIGKAEFIQHSGDVKIMFDYYIKMWLDGGRLRIIRPQSGSRSSTINCSFREYKVDPSNPKNTRLWRETGSGTATLQVPSGDEVRRINGSMVITERVSGDDSAPVNETPQRFVIFID
jgi:hypothetical protein